ncbi:NAD-dependent epimerase/dehydratase family protein [Euzebya tangerina]|uniref:NAD-dependent epimerase/dehydratase family protein n=1 Tax=Euzebya tangerina TaxID=591198 RepID=UPI00196A3460|nr:NAD-dependent epimerase/dehydratase family protein [Euzebya tangerina]
MRTPTADEGGRRILITGIAGTLAGRLALRLEEDDRVDYVGGVDLQQPSHDLKRTEFVRADLRNPLVARVIESTRVDTIVHMSIVAEPGSAGGRGRMKELNVIGTMQMLGAAQKAPMVRNLVLRSTTAVYGAHYRDPALFREDNQPRTAPRSGYTKDITEVEAYARGLGRRRPDIDLTILRFANIISSTIETTITKYFALPVIPTVLGHDPRLQLLHTDDAVEVLYRATMGSHPGIFNVAGPGIVYLSQAARMTGRPSVLVPAAMAGMLSTALQPLTGIDITGEQLPMLQFGRVADITRMRREFDFEPAYSSKQALQEFIDAGRVQPLLDADQAGTVEQRVGDALIGALGRFTA